MKTQVKVITKTKSYLSKDQAEKAWLELDKYRKKLADVNLAQIIIQSRI